MADVLALPSASFKSLGSMRRERRRTQQEAPIQVETMCRGSYGVAVAATGTAAQLIAAGVCAAEHLPPGRKRCAYWSFEAGPFDHWSVRRLKEGRIRVYAHRRSDTEAEINAGYDFHVAHKALQKAEAADAAADLREALMFAIRYSQLNGGELLAGDKGAHFEARAADRLKALFSEIDALLARAEMLVKSATVEVDSGKRAAYLLSLRDAVMLPMPSLPSVMPQSLRLVASAAS